MSDSAKISIGLGKDLQELVRKSGQVPQFRPKSQPASRARPGQVVPFMLLEDVESGEKAKASRLTAGSAWSKYLLTTSGLKDEDGEFQLEWNEETIEDISINATPAELQETLLGFTFLNAGDVLVQFGNHSRSVSSRGSDDDVREFNVYRWIVKTRPGLESLGLFAPNISQGEQTWMGSEVTQLEDSHQVIEVQSVLPVGVNIDNNSPMQAGAIGLASYVHTPENSLGWVISSLEARNLTGDFTELPFVEY